MLHQHIKKIIDDASSTMDKAYQHLVVELQAVRAGRATPAMIENVRVDVYGTQMPLNQVGSISAPQPDMLVVQAWDASSLGAIEKAIMSASMGLNPSNDGTVVRIPVPPLSEERRRDLVKTARSRGEEAKVAIRNIRRHAKDEVKSIQAARICPRTCATKAKKRSRKSPTNTSTRSTNSSTRRKRRSWRCNDRVSRERCPSG